MIHNFAERFHLIVRVILISFYIFVNLIEVSMIVEFGKKKEKNYLKSY
jgi:hypothetical protein